MKKFFVLLAVTSLCTVFVGCKKSDEQKLEDAAKQAQKDAAKKVEEAQKAVKDVKLPGLGK